MTELVRRYVVMPLATDAPFDPVDPDGAFVLKPWKDPAALRALRAYRDSCFPELRRDLDAWIRAIESGPTVRGDIGRRNEPFARTASLAVKRTTAPAPVAKATTVVKAKPASRTPAATRATTTVRTALPGKGATTAKRPAAAKATTGGRALTAGKAKRTATRGPAPTKPAKKRRR